MKEFISISYHLSASPATTGTTNLYRVPGGKRLKVLCTNITFPSASDYELHVAFYRGIKKQLPTEGDYIGDDTRTHDNTIAEWGTDENVILWYKNDSTTATKDCDILLECELIS